MDELMTVPEMAARMKKSAKTIYHYVESEEIPASMIIRLGNSIRMRVSDLEKWIESHRGA